MNTHLAQSATLQHKDIINADTLNAHLANGGIVYIGTCTRITKYTKRHAGYFSQGNDGCLYVQSGKRKNCLSLSNGYLMVGIRLS